MMVNRIIFEGPDDQHVVMNLLFNHEHQGQPLCTHFNEDNIKVKGGVDHLIDTLKEEIGATDLGRLGVILDADTNLDAQWARVTRVLEEYGCDDVPRKPNANGTVVETRDGKCIGIWVMPDNQSAGALEDFVGKLIGEEDNLWPKAQADVNGIPADNRRFKTTYLSKAQVHTWLAWQEEPGTKMGETFKKRYLDPEHPQALIFVEWVKQLLT
jgi:hypothetical protein